jgi:membrane protease YdiL (CAAX protease family)
MLFDATGSHAAVGLGSAVVLYGMTRVMAGIEPSASQATFIDTWRAGHSPLFLTLTVGIAVAGEELFWRGAHLSLLCHRLPVLAAAWCVSSNGRDCRRAVPTFH